MTATLSFLAHWWPWVIVAVLGTVGLGYAAFILRNWRLAVGAAAIVAAWLITQWFWSAGYKAKVDENKAAQIARLNNRIKLQDSLLTDYEGMAKRDEAELVALQAQIDATPKNDAACLPKDATGRIGAVK